MEKIQKQGKHPNPEEGEFPPLFDINEDIGLIYGEYSKYWNFYNDYETIPFYEFDEKVYSLTGKIQEAISLRQRFLTGEKMQKEEKLIAMKILTNAQQDYYDKKKSTREAEVNAEKVTNFVANAFAQNRERRLRNGNRKNNL